MGVNSKHVVLIAVEIDPDEELDEALSKKI